MTSGLPDAASPAVDLALRILNTPAGGGRVRKTDRDDTTETARARRPVRLLCFVDEHLGLAAPEEPTATARARNQPREARRDAEPGHAIDIPVEH